MDPGSRDGRHAVPGYWLGVEVLPDIVAPEPVVLFCGMAGAESTKTRDRYYASPDRVAWPADTPVPLQPEVP